MLPIPRPIAPVLSVLLVLGACTATPPAASPTPVASTPPVVASPSPTPVATPSPSAAPVAGVLTPANVTLPSPVVISAPSRDVVWALTGGDQATNFLFRSTDGGQTWEQRPVPPTTELTRVSFVDDRSGWIIERGRGCPVWHTSDGGATYTPVGPAGAGGGSCDGALALATEEVGHWVTSEGDDVVAYRSADAGRTWKGTALPVAEARFDPRADVSAREVRAFGTTVLALLTGRFGDEGGQAVYQSTDGGATWSLLTTVADRAALTFVTATRWLEIGSPGDHHETTDAGATWHEFVSDYQQAAPVFPVTTFADADVGYATVRGTIQRTTDGGARWELIHTPGT